MHKIANLDIIGSSSDSSFTNLPRGFLKHIITNITLQSAKLILAGLATIGLTGVGAGVGIVFGSNLITEIYILAWKIHQHVSTQVHSFIGG
jgi:hypothetical protein